MSLQKHMLNSLKIFVDDVKNMKLWRGVVVHAHPDLPIIEWSLLAASKKSYWGGTPPCGTNWKSRRPSPVTNTSHDAFIQTKLDKTINLGNEGQVLTPFISSINSVKLPKGFVKPELCNYDGSNDPKDFMSTFKYTIDDRGCNATQMHKFFPEYLQGTTDDWYNKLLKNTISLFREFAMVFLDRVFFQKSIILGGIFDILNVR